MIKNIIKITTIISLLIILQGCPPPICDPEITEYQPLTDSAISFIPYLNGQTYKLQHSAGHVISFSCERKKEKLNNCFDCEKCISYEQDITTLKPDYQINDITIRITSDSEEGQHQLYLDSLYFNNEKGIISITMSNDEYYHYYEN